MNFKGNQSRHPLYSTWNDMKRRCYVESRPEYINYGGRGIEVCNRWLGDFWLFVKDMGKKPKGYSLDRIDNDGHYCPENCKWSSRKEQNKNKRNEYVNTKHKNIYKVSTGYQVILTKPRRKYIGTFKSLLTAKKALKGVSYQLHS